MVLNQQDRVSVDLPGLRGFVNRLRRAAQLGRREFNVCLVNDEEIRRLNAIYRGKPRPTDVLSFPWQADSDGPGKGHDRAEFGNFLGDVVISVETARNNARVEAHSTLNELRWLILHGVLHLLGYDHENDDGEMNRLELSLREELGIAACPRRRKPRRRRRVRHE